MVAFNPNQTQLLIADDNTAFREIVVEIVEPYFDTIAVPSAEAAIEVMGRCEIHLAIFDLNMELMSGLDAIRWLRDRRLAFPCILMSSELTEEITAQAYFLSTHSVLKKPVGRNELLDTIHCALEL